MSGFCKRNRERVTEYLTGERKTLQESEQVFFIIYSSTFYRTLFQFYILRIDAEIYPLLVKTSAMRLALCNNGMRNKSITEMGSFNNFQWRLFGQLMDHRTNAMLGHFTKTTNRTSLFLFFRRKWSRSERLQSWLSTNKGNVPSHSPKRLSQD
jgi:hypothetical protein